MRPIVIAMSLAACGGAAVAPPPAPPPSPGPPPAAPAAPAPAAPVAKAPPAPPQPSARPAQQPPRPAAPGRLPIGAGDYGTAGPTLIRAADPAERWLALCQARADTDGDGKIEIHIGHHGDLFGDEMALYLVLGGGDGTPIDALAGRSADGRWLAIVRDGRLELVDANTGELTVLRGADVASDGRPGAPHRAAMFAGDRLLYIRHPGGADDRLVVHDPATHAERELAVPGRLWRIDYIPDRPWPDRSAPVRLAHLYTTPQGQPFPALQTTLGRGECLGPAMSYSTYGNRGPQPTERWIDLDTGAALADTDGAPIAVGATLVRTPADGALYFDADQIAPPACKAQVLAVLPAPVRVIAICGEHKQAKVLLLGKGLRKELAAIDRDDDHYGGVGSALAPTPAVVCDAGLHCVVAATNQPVDLKGGVAEYAWGTKLYVVHATTASRGHEVIDVTTGARTPLRAAGVERAEGRYVLDSDDNLVDLDAVAVLGKVPGALRVSAFGRALRTAAAPPPGGALGRRLDSGPLRWAAP